MTNVNMIKKIGLRVFTLSLLLISLMFLFGCEPKNENNGSKKEDNKKETIDLASQYVTDPVYDGSDVLVSKISHTEDGVTYIEVEGSPFLYIGTQMRIDAYRNCDKYDFDFIDELFKSAKGLGVTSIQVPVEWRDLEDEEDIWDFSELDALLSLALINDIKIELLWFGTNMCGESHSYSVPNYIIKDGVKYTKLDASRIGEFWSYYGMMWFLDLSDEDLLERETNAINKMMDHIYNWDSTHGGTKPVIGVQILNETDILARWRNGQKEICWPSTGVQLTTEEIWSMVNNALDTYGKAVKNSKYKVYTRTNFASISGNDNIGGNAKIFEGNDLGYLPQWAIDIYNLEGIDIVGDDIYSSIVKNCSGMIRLLSEKLEGNFGHLPENAGDYSNLAYIVLATVASGGGMSIYDYATSPFYIRHKSSDGVDQGITEINDDNEIVLRKQYAETKTIIYALRNAGFAANTVHYNDFAVFNLKGNTPSEACNQTIRTTKAEFTYVTESKAYGFGITLDDSIILFSSGSASITINNANITKIETGYFDASNNWVKTGEVTNNTTFNMDGSSLYRVSVDSYNGTLVSNTMGYLG